MDTSCEVEELRYDVKTLINLFFKDPENAETRLKPSVFMEEMSLSFEERIDSLSAIRHRKVNFPSYKPSKYFSAFPPFILIQSFTCGKPHVVMLELKCKAKVIKSLCLVSENNPVFTLECTSRLMSRVAPGMSVKYKVTFFPAKEKDYYYDVKFETDGESFRVPILAIKSRPLLDFPNQITIPPIPVKMTGSKSFVLRNLGKVEAIFCMECSNRLFAVEPDKAVLQPGSLMTVSLKIFSAVVGVYNGFLTVYYETGEELAINVQASTFNSNVFLNKKSLSIPDVFMTLREKQTFRLVNESDNLIKFSWQKYSSLKKDLVELERLKHHMEGMQFYESARSTFLEYNDIVDAALHSSIYQRIFSDEISLLSNENLSFQHSNFKIIPPSGEVYPGGSVEIMVIFEALEPLVAECHAYCECTGIEDRLDLIINGRSIGPDLKINLNLLNVSKVPLCAERSFEILAKNCGDIPGNFEYAVDHSFCKTKITCKPRRLYLLPGETKEFFLHISSTHRGEFMEDVEFVILESKEKINLVVM